MRRALLPALSVLTVLLTSALAAPHARADSGMWTFDNFPSDLVKRKYGVDIDQAWLDRVRTATVRLANCTASFVSASGLILTNHHCSEACLDEHSTAAQNLLRNGFLARSRERELRCGSQVADVLVGMENVTSKVAAAIHGLDDKTANQTRKKTLTQLEQACEESNRNVAGGALKCESVNLYQGGQYWLYKYRRYDDVRLVFAPERDIAAFGGDPDNFQFPRWCLDMSVLRAYGADGKPAHTPDFLTLRREGPQAGDVVFVAGHPGRTDRLLTVAQLQTLRDVILPHYLLRAEELRGRMIQFGKTSAEASRIVEDPLAGLENGIKVRRGQLAALLDERLLDAKRADEAALRAKLSADSQLAAATGDPWADTARAESYYRGIELPYAWLEQGGGFQSALFTYARTLVRGAAERAKPNTERLREFRDAALPRVLQRLSAPVPVYPQLERLTLSFSLERMREWLGPDAPLVRALLSKDSPDSLAARLIDGSQLADAAVRRRLWDGGAAAVDASHDPMVELARTVDPEARAVRKRYEDQVEAPVDAAAEKIAAARFQLLGTSEPPDATFTLRLNFGSVQGWKENGAEVEPFTHLARLFERATGADPFRIPDSWLAVRAQLDPAARFDLSTSNDIIGGNSGSPLIDARGQVVGLMFDGNIHSLSGDYWYDAALNRAVAVDTTIIFEALRKVYRANELLAELGAK
jgi:peptidase S46-like protein